MEQANSVIDDIRSVEDPHLLRLTSVLSEMVRRGGLKGAARELGIDYRTVKVSMDEGRLTRRCREALERALVERVALSASSHIISACIDSSLHNGQAKIITCHMRMPEDIR